jgi:50S ribosomal protein L16 3-hydroxylase
MMTLTLDRKKFLSEYWQQKPLLIKAGFANFNDLIEAEILAGLAQEAEVDSRVIENRAGTWQVSHGPFASYDQFGDSDWTLLVQSVNEWMPEIHALLEPFRFLPDWRLDDVMISFAVPGGSVGPHLDQYDVFIIQGEGQRHWQVGERVKQANEFRPHADLKQLQDPFVPVIDAVLEAGDILYIPAGCPHHGVALEASLNYSVGFRAANTAELTSQVADMLLAAEAPNYPRYRDPQAADYGAGYQVSAEQLAQLRSFLFDSLQQTDLDNLLLQVMSQSKRPLPQPDFALTWADVAACIDDDMLLCRTAGARLLIDPPQQQLYASGDCYELTNSSREFAVALAEQWLERPLRDYAVALQHQQNQQLICHLLNDGVFHLVSEADDDGEDA